MTDVPPIPVTAPIPAPAPAPTAVVSNPLTWLTDFIGSANVQKVFGMLQVFAAGATNLEGKSLGQKISGMTLGGVFTLGIHFMDWLRTK